jgi:signal transduction histidine kinase
MRRKDEIGALARTVNSTAARLEKAREKLAAETESRIKAVEQLRHAARLASVGTFASGIAHELGTPLAVVSGRARLIADGTATGPDVVKFAQVIDKQAVKMTSIIRQLLDFARRRSVTLTSESLGDLAEQTIEFLRSTACKERVEFELVRSSEPVRTLVDGVQMQQVLTNLLLNAVDAMPTGGAVTVEVGQEQRARPEDEAAVPEACAVYRVSDQGEGILPQNLDRIFEPFFTTKPVGRGTGLGLAVTYGIITEHGGWIEVDSAVGEGTTFSVYLPLAANKRHAKTSSDRR